MDSISRLGFRWLEEQVAPDHLNYLRELLVHDVRWSLHDGVDRETFRLKKLQLRSLHWSRVFEWPWVLHHAELTKDCRVLDAGGGSSTLTFAVAERCAELVRVDLDAANLREAYAYLDELKVNNVTDEVGDVCALAHPDNSFDRVLHVSVLEHVQGDRLRALREFKRVLKPGGILVLTCDVVIRGEDRANPFPPIKVDDLGPICAEFGVPFPQLGVPIHCADVNAELRIAVYFLKWRKPQ